MKNSKIWEYLVRLSTFHEILEYASAPFANRISGNLALVRFTIWPVLKRPREIN